MPFADRYVLVEDNSPAFNTPVVVYQGPSNTWDAQDRAYGTHYYRVQAVNNTEQGSFFSPYSNTVSVTVNRFNVSKTDLNYGDCATLRWEFTGINAIFVSFTAGGDLMGVVGVDSRTICPSVSTTYRAFIERDNGTDSYEVSVSVAGGGPDACSGNNYTDPIILKFVPSRTSVGPGEFFSVSWEVACADEVYFTQQGFPEIGVTGMETREGIQISQDTEFKLRVHRNGFDFFRTFIVDYSG